MRDRIEGPMRSAMAASALGAALAAIAASALTLSDQDRARFSELAPRRQKPLSAQATRRRASARPYKGSGEAKRASRPKKGPRKASKRPQGMVR